MFILENSPLIVPIPYQNSEDLLPACAAIVTAGRAQEAHLPKALQRALKQIQTEYHKLESMVSDHTSLDFAPELIHNAHQQEQETLRIFHDSILDTAHRSTNRAARKTISKVESRFQSIYSHLFPHGLYASERLKRKLWFQVENVLRIVEKMYKSDIIQHGNNHAFLNLVHAHQEFSRVLLRVDENLEHQSSTLLFTIRVYVVHLVSWVASAPEHRNVAERCLLPLKRWSEQVLQCSRLVPES